MCRDKLLYMRMLKKMLKFSGMLLIGFMFAVSMVLGIVPIVPKRKEQFEIEVKMDEIEKGIDAKETINLSEADS